MNELVVIGVLTLMVITILGGLMALAYGITRYMRIAPPTIDKQKAYECGLLGTPSKSSRIPSGFYLTAILFVLFDIEIIFLYPWAIAYRDMLDTSGSVAYVIALLIFLSFFIIGLFWEIRAKALNWR